MPSMQGSVRRPSAAAQAVALFRHAVYGLVVESDFALGSLPPALGTAAAADIRLVRAAPGYFDSDALRRHYREQSSGTWYRHASLADGGVFFAVPGVLQAEVSADGGTALCARVAAAAPLWPAYYLLRPVRLASKALRGTLPLP